eukprot:gene20504-27295_t
MASTDGQGRRRLQIIATGRTLQKRDSRRRLVARASSFKQHPAWDAAPVVIVGAGVAGLATAVALRKVGVPVQVLESAPNLRAEGSATGLWDNAWKALDVLGVADKLREEFIPLNRVELCRGESGKVLRAFDFEECAAGAGQEFRGVLRKSLLEALASELPSEIITYNANQLTLQLEGGGASPITASMLIGTDGVRSVCAKYLGLSATNYAGYVAYRGVAKISTKDIGLPDNTIRQIWGSGVRAGLYPLDENTLYWFVCHNEAEDAPIPQTPELVAAEALSYVKGWPTWKMDKIIENSSTIARGRMTDRWTPPGSFGKGLVTLAGDAAHPMTPNLGQGACTALEDAVVLAAEVAEVLKERQSASGGSVSPLSASLEKALRQYEAAQSKRTLYLTVRAHLMGAALQIDNPVVCTVRDTFISNFFDPSHFLDHTSVSLPKLAAP